MAKTLKLQAVPQEITQEAPLPPQAESAAPADLIDFPEPETPVKAVPRPKVRVARKSTLSAEEELALINEAEGEDIKRTFALELMEARKPVEQVVITQPPIPRLMEQTRLEMEAGRAAVAKVAAERGVRPAPVKEKWDGNTVSVFRPEDYAEYKETFKSTVQTADKGRGSLPLK